MSAEVKVLSTSTRTNLEALKHHMKKLGFKYFEEKDGWINFSPEQCEINGELCPRPGMSVDVATNYRMINSIIDKIDLYDKLPEVKQAILDFYEAEGITDED
ncbi:hypothetical protein LMB54_07105 [Limosilactobacillus reuteri]|uniref:hypothetical protein n=1 Tax=Limosilactobacillus reuteri TaxID=1598 RepID=UPI001E5AFF10|nr:hypothetical protein [Limosilactobacillus reuteri]MCC4383576.1 hypothetical protein [Limosilactobacillus reuteri]MCC4420341.1 hypothetical protein [Limosilactobacillus reuteri]MCC4422005.1 hypothetical protein [Limosilactobacillus reuteri]